MQPVEKPAAEAPEDGGRGNGLESWLTPMGTGVSTVSLQICDRAVMAFQAAMDIGKFLPESGIEAKVASHSCVFCF